MLLLFLFAIGDAPHFAQVLSVASPYFERSRCRPFASLLRSQPAQFGPSCRRPGGFLLEPQFFLSCWRGRCSCRFDLASSLCRVRCFGVLLHSWHCWPTALRHHLFPYLSPSRFMIPVVSTLLGPSLFASLRRR